jgi:hypothetical protein
MLPGKGEGVGQMLTDKTGGGPGGPVGARKVCRRSDRGFNQKQTRRKHQHTKVAAS